MQLAAAEAELRRRTNEHWLRRGVTMLDPDRTYIDATVELGADVTLFPGTMLQGRCVIGAGAELGPATRLVDCEVGERTVVEQVVGRAAIVARIPASARSRHSSPGRRSPTVRSPDRSTLRPVPGRAGLHMPQRRRESMELVQKKRLHLVTGRVNVPLAEEIASRLGVALGDASVAEFANGELHCRFRESVRGTDVFIVQSHAGVGDISINDALMEQLVVVNTAARLGPTHHGRLSVLRVQPAGPQGRGA